MGGFNISLSSVDRSGKQKLSRDTVKLIEAADQLYLSDIYSKFHPKAKEYTFFSASHGTFSKSDHITGNKPDFNKFKKIKIIHASYQITME